MSGLLVTGAGGLLGRAVVRIGRDRGETVIPVSRGDLDITDRDAVARSLRDHAPDVVLNCAAFTGVDSAEEQETSAFRVNRDGAGNLAVEATGVGALMAQVSTDFVFDGRSSVPYGPDDQPGPLGVYGRSKLEGERIVTQAAAHPLIVRTSWLYGATGRNFVTAILSRAERGEELRVVDDQTGSPTWVDQMARCTLDLISKGARGIWHVAGRGEATWHDLATEALRIRGVNVPVARVGTREWGAPAPRPRYSALDVSQTESLLSRRIAPWQEALYSCLARD